MEILQTDDYNSFKYMHENRDIERGHVLKLCTSIIKENLLHVNPIIVDPDMFVIDGQHRLEACKVLKIPVSYIVNDKPCTHQSLFLLQQAKQWTLREFVDFYIKTIPNSPYLQFQKDNDTFGLSYDCLSYLYALFSFQRHRKGFYLSKNLIRKGGFNFNGVDIKSMHATAKQYLKFKAFCEDRVIRPKSIYNSTASIIGFFAFYGFYAPNMNRLLTQLKNRWFTLVPGRSYRGMCHSLVKMYNYKRHENILTYDSFETESFKSTFCLGVTANQLSLDIEE